VLFMHNGRGGCDRAQIAILQNSVVARQVYALPTGDGQGLPSSRGHGIPWRLRPGQFQVQVRPASRPTGLRGAHRPHNPLWMKARREGGGRDAPAVPPPPVSNPLFFFGCTLLFVVSFCCPSLPAPPGRTALFCQLPLIMVHPGRSVTHGFLGS